jgi:hypothetical protein
LTPTGSPDTLFTMSDTADVKLDRRAISVASLHDPSDETAYWLSRSPAERIEAIEAMRRIIYGDDPAATRLQRLLEIAQCPPR